MRCVKAVLLLMPCLLLGVLGYPRGAPEGACGTLEPYHTGSRRNPTKSPYQMEAEVGVNGVTVTISGPVFKGYMVQGFSSVTPQQVLGTFTGGPNTVACGAPGDTATHGDNVEKPRASLTWSPPARYSGDIYFRATVVPNITTYYTNIYSNKITL